MQIKITNLTTTIIIISEIITIIITTTMVISLKKILENFLNSLAITIIRAKIAIITTITLNKVEPLLQEDLSDKEA